MYPMTYRRPSSLAEAERCLADDPEAKLLAGGMTLIPTMKQRLAAPSVLVDIARLVELQGVSECGGTLTLGAAATHFDVAADERVRRRIPALSDLAGWIGDPHVRHRGTIGGSLANADPSADYPAAVLGLAATVHTNRRTIEADGMFTGMFETALEEGEIVTKLAFPVPRRAGYAKFRNPASGYAIVGVFVAQFEDGSVRVAVTGAGPSVFRVGAMEGPLRADFAAGVVAGLEEISPEGLLSDMNGSAEYRAHLVKVMAMRAVERATAERKRNDASNS